VRGHVEGRRDRGAARRFRIALARARAGRDALIHAKNKLRAAELLMVKMPLSKARALAQRHDDGDLSRGQDFDVEHETGLSMDDVLNQLDFELDGIDFPDPDDEGADGVGADDEGAE
jgi:hypothetical protein